MSLFKQKNKTEGRFNYAKIWIAYKKKFKTERWNGKQCRPCSGSVRSGSALFTQICLSQYAGLVSLMTSQLSTYMTIFSFYYMLRAAYQCRKWKWLKKVFFSVMSYMTPWDSVKVYIKKIVASVRFKIQQRNKFLKNIFLGWRKKKILKILNFTPVK